MLVSKSTYYAWCQSAHKRSTQAEQAQGLGQKVAQVFKESRYSYGSRRVSVELKKQGVIVGRYKVRRLMQALNLVVRYPKRNQVTTDSRHSESIAPNTLDRQFRVSLIRYGQLISPTCGHYKVGCPPRGLPSRRSCGGHRLILATSRGLGNG